MTERCAYKITSYEPIVEGLVRMEQHFDGWTLWIRHRHYGGAFMDCEPDDYGRLTLEELADVLTATVAGWASPRKLSSDQVR